MRPRATFLKNLVGALAVLFSHQAAAQSAEVLIACRMDLAPLGPGSVTVQITRLSQGGMQAQIDGKVSNPNVRADEYAIRPNLDLKTDAYSPAAATLNGGESSLVHLQSLLDNKDLGGLIKIPFDLKQVKRMRIFDLQGKPDKFGGTVLMEAYNQNGKLLGRVFRSVIVATCN
jgi:hypothetical protein